MSPSANWRALVSLVEPPSALGWIVLALDDASVDGATVSRACERVGLASARLRVAVDRPRADLTATLQQVTDRLRAHRGLPVAHLAQGLWAAAAFDARGVSALVTLNADLRAVGAARPITLPTLLAVDRSDAARLALHRQVRQRLAGPRKLIILDERDLRSPDRFAAALSPLAINWVLAHLSRGRTADVQQWLRQRWPGVPAGVARPLSRAALVALAASLLAQPYLRAAVATNFDGTTLTVTGDGAADNILIDCSGADQVQVNGTVVPGAACSTLPALLVNAGDGADTVDLQLQAFNPALVPSVFGGAGNDDLRGSDLNDSLDGGDGSDIVAGGFGNDTLAGGSGNDVLAGGDGTNRVDGGDGDDSLEAYSGLHTVLGGAGTDTLTAVYDGNQILTDTALVTDVGTIDVAGIEAASLYGGAGPDVLDASGFSGRVQLVGGEGDDTLLGGPLDDVFDGQSGSDSMDGGGGTDELRTTGADFPGEFTGSLVATNTSLVGLGNDVLAGIERLQLTGDDNPNTIDASGFSGVVTVTGRDGADSIVGAAGPSYLRGDAGNDSLSGGAGQDTLEGGAGDDSLSGQLGNDTLDGGQGFDTLTGGEGDDTLRTTAGDGLMQGGEGADRLYATFPRTGAIDGGDGADWLLLGSTSDLTLGPDSITTPAAAPSAGRTAVAVTSIERTEVNDNDAAHRVDASALPGPLAIYANGGDDTLIGGLARDTILGGSGNDQISGGPEADDLMGEAGNDTIAGGTGDDLLFDVGSSVTAGAASLTGTGLGTDVFDSIELLFLYGTAGNDTLDASQFNGFALLTGDAGNDRLTGSRDATTFEPGAGNDTVIGLSGYDQVNATSTANLTLTPTSLVGLGNDVLTGIERARLAISGATGRTIDARTFTGPVALFGDAGNDTLLAGAGNDTLTGRGGNDSLDGGAGTDLVDASANANFVLTSALLTGLGSDVLTSIEAARIDGGASANLLDASSFPGSVTLNGQGGNDTLLGGAGDDRLVPDTGDNTVHGGGGIDSLLGLGAPDLTFTNTAMTGNGTTVVSGIEVAIGLGTGGANRLDASGFAGRAVFQGLGGDDTLIGTAGPEDVVEEVAAALTLSNAQLVGNGTDTLIGIERARLVAVTDGSVLDASAFTGPVTLFGSWSGDVLRGGSGADYILGGTGNDTLVGGPGDDELYGQWDNDSMDGGAGNDLLSSVDDAPYATLTSADTLRGGDGDDRLGGGLGDDGLDGGPGTDVVLAAGDADFTLTNTTLTSPTLLPRPSAPARARAGFVTDRDSDDGEQRRAEPSTGEDAMAALIADARVAFRGAPPPSADGARAVTLGTDTLTAIESGWLMGGAGANRLDASAFTGAVTLNGLGGDDTLIGGSGANTITGDDGNDLIEVRAAATSVVDGGAGADTARLDAGSAPLERNSTGFASGGHQTLTPSNVEAVALVNALGEPPTIAISSPATSPVTHGAALISLTGIAGDDAAVTGVTWFSDRGPAGTSEGTTAWTSRDVPLVGGANVIAVRARDAAGNTAVATVTVNVGATTYQFAEGATGAYFDHDLHIANPGATAAPVTITYLKDDGTTVVQAVSIAAQSLGIVRADDVAGLAAHAVAAVVQSDTGAPLIVERQLTWAGGAAFGAHATSAIVAPSTRWYFADGQQGFFETFLLLGNANAAPANVTVRFLTESDGVVTRTLSVGAQSRLTINAGAIPALAGRSFGMVVESDLPIAAERSMYFGGAANWVGGHASVGAPAPALRWEHAEGATGAYFDTFILLANPNAVPANVALTFRRPDGQTVPASIAVPPLSRRTIIVETVHPLLADSQVATSVASDVPIVSERTMAWPGSFATWFESHGGIGAVETALKWGIGGGLAGTVRAGETYLLLANPQATAAAVRLTFLRQSGAPVVKTVAVPAGARLNVPVATTAPELVNESFAVLVEATNGVPISVERSTYWTVGGEVWAAGTDSRAIKIP